jgi:hypothetical protein
MIAPLKTFNLLSIISSSKRLEALGAFERSKGINISALASARKRFGLL